MVKKRISRNKGMSLVELIIAVGIMAILSASIAPAVIRYIDKSRKARDVEVAQTIVDAAQLAMTTSEDDAYYGWTVCVDYYGTDYPARVLANDDGTPVSFSSAKTCNSNQYFIRPVAWARGVDYKGWENSLFKSTLDGGGKGDKQRAYTDEFLWALSQEMAQGGADKVNRNYDGKSDVNMSIKYNKKLKARMGGYSGKMVSPELWLLYRRDDNGQPEVWTGYKKGNVTPLYRVYPSPSKEYK